ncbi:MAG TPA: phosphopantothenoylcysteine decarboxylase, partial [Nitrospiria bacterium]
ATIAVMAAAVSDFQPLERREHKVKNKESSWKLELEPTPDILSEMARKRKDQILVGFAAETENLNLNARSKLAGKGLDLIVANDVTRPGAGFDVDTNIVTLIDRTGDIRSLPRLSKTELADRILTRIKKVRNTKPE